MSYPTVLVRWRDATSERNIPLDEAGDLTLCLVETVGFLVKYDSEHLVILNGMVDGNHAQDTVVIPSSTVDEVIPLGEGTWHGKAKLYPEGFHPDLDCLCGEDHADVGPDGSI